MLYFILAIPSPPTTSSPFIELNKTNVIAIAVSVAVVVIALVVVIGCFVVRHKRLQRSFRAYASSHYDSSTGTTTFSAADELGMSCMIKINPYQSKFLSVFV